MSPPDRLYSEEHLKREKKLGTPCPFFSTAESAAPASSLGKSTARAPSSRASTKPPSRAGSKKPPVSQQGPSDTPSSESESDLAGSTTRAPAPRRALKRSTSTSSVAADSTRRSMRSSRSKPPSEPEEEASGSDNGRRALARSTRGKAKGKAREVAVPSPRQTENYEPVSYTPRLLVSSADACCACAFRYQWNEHTKCRSGWMQTRSSCDEIS